METPCKLSDFIPGQTAEILRLDLPEAEAQRLKGMGIFAGQSIEIRKTGDNFIVTAAGGRIAIARQIARHILVLPTNPQAA